MMTAQVQSHPTTIEASAPAQVAVGDEIVVKLTVTCSQGCDLHGLPVEPPAADGEGVQLDAVRGRRLLHRHVERLHAIYSGNGSASRCMMAAKKPSVSWRAGVSDR